MKLYEAKDLIRTVFEQAFDKGHYTYFIKNLLKDIEEKTFTYSGNIIPNAFENYIRKMDRIGKFEDEEGNLIDILIVELKREHSIEYARSTQRNFIRWYLNGSRGGQMKEAALVAFHSAKSSDWRFSLVKMDYKFEKTKTGKVRVKEELTPARRWSFLVGENEGSHTAQSRLVDILANDEQAPTLIKIENAFDIETVTKEFFLKYRELFMRTKEELDRVVNNDPKIKADFADKGVDTVNFTKKLLGQIVFLYFLQKKGWFGVARGHDWGAGSKQFLRELFRKKHANYNNFFNDILEPLFYEALRRDRSDDDGYYKLFDCKIPFLNGGLFDPIGENGGYDWVSTEILLADNLFSNKNKTKEGDTGNGILDIFDRYNFTVREDEPLEKEVAIDPELLGKAYEKFNAIRPDNYVDFKNALKSGRKGEENKFNKKFGVYYTPREIVHYMCQQSLINYLYTQINNSAISYQNIGDSQTDILGNKAKKGQLNLTGEHQPMPKISKADIETLIHTGEHIGENEAWVTATGKETKTYSYKTPESIRNKAAQIDVLLANITVCDPAVGSGAFPVGMMSEIVKIRNVLAKLIQEKTLTTYEFKRRCIEHSLYGVDIDPGAVEIAKLRLWLSLVVDEEDIKNIKPLPNLDYKIVRGNSLVGFPEDWESPIAKEIERLKFDYFNETSPTKKNGLKKTIDEKLNKRYKNSLKTFGYKIDFDFRMVFSEVFHSQGGFDVVIANPPYVNAKHMQKNTPKERTFLKNTYKLLTDKWDLYVAFIEKAMNVSGRSSLLTMIIPNAFVKENYSKKMREYLISNKLVKSVVFYEYDIFDAAVNNIVLLIQKPVASEFEQLIYQTPTSYALKEIHVKDIFNSTDSLLSRLLNTERILGDVCFISVGMVLNAHESIAKGEFIKDDLICDLEDKIHSKRYTEGKWIDKYQIKTIKYLEWGTKRVPSKIRRKTFQELYEKEKILINKLGNIKATYDNSRIYCDQTIRVLIKYIDLKGIENKSINGSIKKYSQTVRGELDIISKGYLLKFILALLNTPLYNHLLNILTRCAYYFNE